MIDIGANLLVMLSIFGVRILSSNLLGFLNLNFKASYEYFKNDFAKARFYYAVRDLLCLICRFAAVAAAVCSFMHTNIV